MSLYSISQYDCFVSTPSNCLASRSNTLLRQPWYGCSIYIYVCVYYVTLSFFVPTVFFFVTYLLVFVSILFCRGGCDRQDAMDEAGETPENMEALKTIVMEKLGEWYMRNHGVGTMANVEDMCTLLQVRDRIVGNEEITGS